MSIDNWIRPIPGSSQRFATVQTGVLNNKPKDVSLIPFYKIHQQRYTLYWKMYSSDEWKQRKEIISDEVNPSSAQDEKFHAWKGEKTDTSSKRDDRNFWENNTIGRLARDGGWFSYELSVNQKAERQFLVVTYWGSTPVKHEFEILLDDHVLKAEDLTERWPLRFHDEAYELPQNLIKGKARINIKFKAKDGMYAGPVYGLKITSDPGLFKNYLFY